MPKLQATRGAQYLLAEEFVFTHQNWVVDSADGAKKTFGSTVAASTDPAETLLTGPVANTVVFDGMFIPRGAVITGGTVRIDDLYIHEFRHVPNTRTAASGAKWGNTGTVNGCRMLFCGAQAMGMADIGNPEWVEKGFDYENQQGIATGKILGFLKPKFYSQYSGGTVEDFGLIAVDVAQ